MRSILTVTTPAESEELTTLETVKAELEITVVDFDARLAAYITQASDDIADWCNTTFGKAGYTQTFFDGTQSDLLVLARKPILSVISIVEADQTLDPAADYMIDGEAGLIHRLPGNMQGWAWGWSGERPPSLRWGWAIPKIVVVYEAGFDLLDGLPPTVERACIELVKSMWFSTRDPALSQINIPGVVERRYSASRGDVSTDSALPRSVTDRLQSFRRFL